MGVITPTRFTIGGVAIDDVSVIEITISRGVMPSTFGVIVAREGTADKALRVKRNPVTLKIECADYRTVGKDEIELQEWYIISRREREQGMVQYTLADVRWAKSFNKLTAEYNIVSYGGLYRPRSTQNGRPWKALFAAEDALKKLGYTVADLGDARFTVGSIELPDNLGNDDLAAGWVGASQEDAIPPMLESVACDPAPTADGKLAIVDRFTENSKNLQKYAMAVGDVAEADVEWQKPVDIIVPFRKRVERRLHYAYTESATAATLPEYDVSIDNVMPNWKPAESGGPTDHVDIADWIERTAVAGFKYLSLKLFRQRYLKRQTFDVHGGFTAAVLRFMKRAQDLVRACYWLRFRFRPDTSAGVDKARSNYADIRLERLKADGTGRPGGVFMDYVRRLTDGRLPHAKANPLAAEFSENVTLNRDEPAPAKAVWIDRENLVFEVRFDTPDSDQTAGYYPGLLDRPLSYGGEANFRRSIAGKQQFTTLDTAELRSRFQMETYWHGLWIGNGDGDMSRTYDYVAKGAKSARGRPKLTVACVMDMTANYAFKHPTGEFPGRLLNFPELAKRAKQIVAEVSASMEQKRAGITTHVGIGVLTRGKVWVGGDIHEIKIIINGRKPGSVETRVTVLPGRRPAAKGPVTGRRGEAAMESARII